ncbi:hypothetical protein D3C71_665540 [compost metagenome]
MEIIGLPQICRNFPVSPLVRVERESQLDAIENSLKNNVKILFIDGEEGIGKTILLSQLIERNPNGAIGLFITPISSMSYSKEYITTTITEQLYWIFNSTRYTEDIASAAELFKLTLKFQKYARSNDAYFVIDGLTEISLADRQEVINFIFLNALQIGIREFKFVISGSADKLKIPSLEKVSNQTQYVLPMDKDQIKKYFSECNLSDNEINGLKTFSRGLPSRLEVALRALRAGDSLEDIISMRQGALEDLFNLDWNRIDFSEISESKNMLAICTFARREITCEDVSRITSQELKKVKEFLNSIPFLEVSSEIEPIRFRSEAQRRLVGKKMESIRIEISESLISDLSNRAQDRDSLIYLAEELSTAGRDDQVLSTLSNEHFENLLEREQSLQIIKKHSQIGLFSAEKKNLTPVVVQYAITGAVIHDLESTNSSRMLIQALLRLDKNEEAISYASSAPTKEDRFALLAHVGRYFLSEKQHLPSELKEQIISASKHVDFKSLGGRAAELANDLVAIDPDLAIELLQSSMDSSTDAQDRDAAFASLHLATSSMNLNDNEREKVSKKTRDKIGNTKFQEFADAAESIFSKYNADQVIERMEKLDFEHRMFFTHTWLNAKYKDPSALKVAEFALKLLIENTEYTPKLTDFLSIAKTLPYITEKNLATDLQKKIEIQKCLVSSHGTSEVYIRIQMLFLLTETEINIDKACERAIDIYSHVDDIDDLAIKSTCLSWILHYLHYCKNVKLIEDLTNLQGACANKLMESITKLLSATFDHYEVVENSIKALAINHYNLAIDLAKKLNTIESRDRSYRLLANTLTSSKAYLENGFTNLLLTINSITKNVERDHTILDVLSKIKQNNDFNISENSANDIRNIWESVKGADSKLLALSFTTAILHKNHKNINDTSKIEEKLKKSWDDISDGGYKLDLGFQLVDILAECNRDLSNKWLKGLLECFANHTLPAEETESTISAVISITIRAMTGIVKAKAATNETWERLIDLIKRLPGSTERIHLWVDLAVRCWAAGDKERCEKITHSYIRPIIDKMEEEYITWRSHLIIHAGPALYVTSSNLAETYLDTLPSIEQDEARTMICLTLRSKMSPSDARRNEINTDYALDYTSAIDLLTVIKKMNHDAPAFYALSSLCDSLIAKRNKDNITSQQKQRIVDELEVIISKKFPDPKNITHDGYKIAAQAKILRVKLDYQRIQKAQWEGLKNQVDLIPNIADQALVLCILALQTASKEATLGKLWFKEARELVNKITSVKDRIDRLRWMSQITGKVDTDFCSINLKEAFRLTQTIASQPDIEEKQRRILDIAYQIDTKLADELLEIIDNDPARKKAKTLRSHLKVLQSRKKLLERDSADTTELSDKELIEISSKNLNSLLVGKFNTSRLDQTLFLLKRAAKIPLRDGGSIWGWFIENISKRAEAVPKEISTLSSVLEHCLNGAELACHLTGRKTSTVRTNATKTLLFRDGERNAALNEFRNWISEKSTTELLISDPYFGPDDLDFIKMVQEVKPDLRLRLLLSENFLKQYSTTKSYEDVFNDKWAEISDESPPRTEIVIVGIKPHGNHPIHERWLISGIHGLRVGTSVHSIGIGRTSEISVISEDDVTTRRNEIEAFLGRNERTFRGERVGYSVIDLY